RILFRLCDHGCDHAPHPIRVDLNAFRCFLNCLKPCYGTGFRYHMKLTVDFDYNMGFATKMLPQILDEDAYGSELSQSRFTQWFPLPEKVPSYGLPTLHLYLVFLLQLSSAVIREL